VLIIIIFLYNRVPGSRGVRGAGCPASSICASVALIRSADCVRHVCNRGVRVLCLLWFLRGGGGEGMNPYVWHPTLHFTILARKNSYSCKRRHRRERNQLSLDKNSNSFYILSQIYSINLSHYRFIGLGDMGRNLLFGKRKTNTPENTTKSSIHTSSGVPIGYTINARSDNVSETSDISGPTVSRLQQQSVASVSTNHKVGPNVCAFTHPYSMYASENTFIFLFHDHFFFLVN
jgi:hypothetical protein